MLRKVTVAIPAKINLTLDITGRREDGYHFLKTVMQSINLKDSITITQTSAERITLRCAQEDIPVDETNLCYRAAMAFFKHTGLPNKGLDIFMDCKIPTQGGLGSASADAAGVLAGLNSLYHTRLSKQELCRLGVGLGADVPFAIMGGTLLAQGIGELFTPLPPLPPCTIVIAKPHQDSKTAECFAVYDQLGFQQQPGTRQMVAALQQGELREVAGSLCNALEQACQAPQVGQFKAAMLAHGALGASMTGSGTAVFGLFDSPRLAEKCAQALIPQAGFVTLAEPVPQGAHLVNYGE